MLRVLVLFLNMQRIIPEFVTSILAESINGASHIRQFEQNKSNLQHMYLLDTCYMYG